MFSSLVSTLACFDVFGQIFKVCYWFFLRLTARLSKMEGSSDSSDAESDCSSAFSDISDRENACDGDSDVSAEDDERNQEQKVTMPDLFNWKK